MAKFKRFTVCSQVKLNPSYFHALRVCNPKVGSRESNEREGKCLMKRLHILSKDGQNHMNINWANLNLDPSLKQKYF